MESACERLRSNRPHLSSRLILQTVDVTGMFRRLRLWRDPEPAIIPPKPLPPLPMIIYDKGLPSLPDDVIHEIFSLLDMESLKSCSLTGKAISGPAKPFLHQTLSLTPQRRRDGVQSWPREPNTPGNWNEFKGLPVLGERGLLQYTRHLSIFLNRNPLFPHDLQRHIQYFHTLTNVRSFKTCWLDIPSFLPKMEEYFGSFYGSLQSLELEHPRGDHKQILYFICQFTNLRDLKIKGLQPHAHSMRNGGLHFDINTFPPLDGVLDLEMFSGTIDMGVTLVLNSLVTVPLNFRTLKLSGCTVDHSKLLVGACSSSLECIDFTWNWMGKTFHRDKESPGSSNRVTGQNKHPQFNLKNHTKLRKIDLRLVQFANAEAAAIWLSGTLSTVTSNEFAEVTIYIARVSHSCPTPSEDQLRRWNSVDDVLDRLSLCEDVTLVVRLQEWTIGSRFEDLVEKYFPLMWENGRVVLEGQHPRPEDESIRRTQ